ncbi:MAG TPA: hypothetical protein VNY10_12515 [Roseiarcus sp.]|jgi:hypothetical protein|nr:hypothetical protein [Roseiarcus sp.]
MTEVTIDFLARRLERILDRIGTIEDQFTVLTEMVIRIDGAVQGLAAEMREHRPAQA